MNKEVKVVFINLLLILLSTAFTFSLVGGVVFIVKKTIPQNNNWHDVNTRFDSELGWAPIPCRILRFQNKIVLSNSLGFRSPEIEPSKKNIVLIGDSVAWGYGVDDNETASFYLQMVLINPIYGLKRI